VSITAGKFTSARRTWWHRVRFQLGLGFLFAVLIPFLVRFRIEHGQQDTNSLYNSLIGTTLALIGGYYAFRRVSHYPGVRASYHILPAFSTAYGLVLVFFFFFRLDYSRLHFLASFLLSVLWYYVVYFKLQRQQRLRIGVVPFGEVETLFAIHLKLPSPERWPSTGVEPCTPRKSPLAWFWIIMLDMRCCTASLAAWPEAAPPLAPCRDGIV